MSCAGATDLYNSVDALVQPVRDDALRPLSGHYLMRLSAGRRSPVLSLLRLARNVLRSSVRTSNSVLCFVSSCGMSHMRPVSASEPRHQEEANFYADRSCLKKPSSSQRTMRSSSGSTSTTARTSSLRSLIGGFLRVHWAERRRELHFQDFATGSPHPPGRCTHVARECNCFVVSMCLRCGQWCQFVHK